MPKSRVKIEQAITQLRLDLIAQGRPPVLDAYQGVTKDRITAVLRAIDRDTIDQRDAVFALLDDVSQSFYRLQYKTFPASIKFCDGATVAHVGCHFGILQRDAGKSDREGRDQWLKPLWEIGAIEKVFFHKASGTFIPGHPIAKSPFTAYRLADSFRAILTAPEDQWRGLLKQWIKESAVRERLELQAQLAEVARARVDTKHSDLISAACDYYVPHFLPDYKVIYIDDADGDRVSEPDRQNLYEAGIEITLDDSMPDVLLWNRETDRLWVIEAVTSDGEVDQHKVSNLTALATRCGKAGIDFTTAYRTWSAAARRQGKHKNLAPGTYIWIQEDPSKHYLAEAFKTKG